MPEHNCTNAQERAAWSALLDAYDQEADGTMGQLRAGMRIAEVSQEAMRRLIAHVALLEERNAILERRSPTMAEWGEMVATARRMGLEVSGDGSIITARKP